MVVLALAALVAGALALSGRVAVAEVETGLVQMERPSSGARTLLTATGHVAARRKASVSARRAGRLVAILVDQGSEVHENQVLARIDDSDVRAALASAVSSAVEARSRAAGARARLDAARTEAARARRLAEAGVGSRVDRDVAEARERETEAGVLEADAAVGSADARVREAEVQLEQSVVRAPFSGVVLRKEAEVGESVAPAVASGQLTRGAIVTLADLESLEVEADVSESRIGLVAEGMPCEIALDAVPERRYAGRLRTIAPTADRQKATIQVKVDILDPDDRVHPEMEAKITFLSGEPDREALLVSPVLTAPASAIALGSGGAPHAFVVTEDVISRRGVVVGERRGERVVIVEGLREGEVVVLSPEGLREGQHVRLARRRD